MPTPPVIAVTGAGSFWGGRLARRLAAAGHRVLAVDHNPPSTPIEAAETVEIELLNPLLPDVLAEYGATHLLHLDFRWERQATDAGFEHNVVGTRRLLEVATRIGLRHLVFMSSTLAYGARPDNPAFIPASAIPR